MAEAPGIRAKLAWRDNAAPTIEDLKRILALDSTSSTFGQLVAVRRLRLALASIESDLELELFRLAFTQLKKLAPPAPMPVEKS